MKKYLQRSQLTVLLWSSSLSLVVKLLMSPPSDRRTLVLWGTLGVNIAWFLVWPFVRHLSVPSRTYLFASALAVVAGLTANVLFYGIALGFWAAMASVLVYQDRRSRARALPVIYACGFGLSLVTVGLLVHRYPYMLSLMVVAVSAYVEEIRKTWSKSDKLREEAMAEAKPYA